MKMSANITPREIPHPAVFLLEDGVALPSSLRPILQARGFRTLDATCDREGLKLLLEEGERVAAVLLSLSAPSERGIAFLRELQYLPVAPKVIVACADAHLCTEFERWGYPVDRFIDSSHSIHAILGEIGWADRHLRKRSAPHPLP